MGRLSTTECTYLPTYLATRIPWRRWKWRPWESVGDADGNLG